MEIKILYFNRALPGLFPRYIQVPASGPVKKVDWLDGGTKVDCTIFLRRGAIQQMNSTQVEWWEIQQDTPKPIFSNDKNLEIIALNDLVPPLHLTFFASKGYDGIYFMCKNLTLLILLISL